MKYFVPIFTKIYEFLVYVSRIYSNKKKGWQHEKEVMSMCTKHPRKRPQFHQRKVMRFYNLTLQQGPEHFWSCIWISIVFEFTNFEDIFSNFILHYYKTRKRVNLSQNRIAMKNWIPFQISVDPIVSYWNLVSPYFLLVFLWPRFLSFSFATFNRSQEELFLSSLANNSDAKHLFKATFVIPEGRHYYILQRFLYASIFC